MKFQSSIDFLSLLSSLFDINLTVTGQMSRTELIISINMHNWPPISYDGRF